MVQIKKVTQIRKRNGEVVPFEFGKIENAVYKAMQAQKVGDRALAVKLTENIVALINERYQDSIPGVEDVQDVVEEILMVHGYLLVARAYITYRNKHADIRKLKQEIGVKDDLKLTVNAIKVLERRYLLRDENGSIIETPRELFKRVARAIAAIETKFDAQADVNELENSFFEVMSKSEFIPNTPTLMNAGTPLGQLSACFVLPVEDSIVDIFDSLKNMAIIHQSGGGTGFSFSHLRPAGDIVRSTKGVASGPVSFMKIFDAATGVMKQGGKRRGANMGILNVNHPDIIDFVTSKSEPENLSNFNISVGITDDFIDRVKKAKELELVNPRTKKVVRTIGADILFELIISNAWRTGDPGLIFLDEINRHNPTPHLGLLEATNPCGELPLLPFESCNLGSINLSRLIKNGKMDWVKLEKLVKLTVHFLDNVIEANVFPLPAIEKVTRNGNRKIGLGVMGFADALVMMAIPYNSEEALDTARKIISFMSEKAKTASIELAEKRGTFPNFKGSIYDNDNSRRLRNATVLSIAPTGTISIIAGCSSGIEPLFALAYVRNVMEGTRLLEVNPVFEDVARKRGFYSDDLMREVARKGSLKGIDRVPEDIRQVFVTDWDISPEWHVRMQSIFQEYTDNSVSKTINLPAESTLEDVRKIYLLAHKLNCKGITIYRYGSKKQQVLTLAGETREAAEESAKYVTVESEFSGGCPYGTCPL